MALICGGSFGQSRALPHPDKSQTAKHLHGVQGGALLTLLEAVKSCFILSYRRQFLQAECVLNSHVSKSQHFGRRCEWLKQRPSRIRPMVRPSEELRPIESPSFRSEMVFVCPCKIVTTTSSLHSSLSRGAKRVACGLAGGNSSAASYSVSWDLEPLDQVYQGARRDWPARLWAIKGQTN